MITVVHKYFISNKGKNCEMRLFSAVWQMMHTQTVIIHFNTLSFPLSIATLSVIQTGELLPFLQISLNMYGQVEKSEKEKWRTMKYTQIVQKALKMFHSKIIILSYVHKLWMKMYVREYIWLSTTMRHILSQRQQQFIHKWT